MAKKRRRRGKSLPVYTGEETTLAFAKVPELWEAAKLHKYLFLGPGEYEPTEELSKAGVLFIEVPEFQQPMVLNDATGGYEARVCIYAYLSKDKRVRYIYKLSTSDWNEQEAHADDEDVDSYV